MIVLGIDPGPTVSGVVWFDLEKQEVVRSEGSLPTESALEEVRRGKHDMVALEVIKALYAHVGESTVQTIQYVGRIVEAAHERDTPLVGMTPQEIKQAVCGTGAAKDPAVRQAIIDKLGPPGIKADPGPTYGVTKHAWRALAAVLAATNLYTK